MKVFKDYEFLQSQSMSMDEENLQVFRKRLERKKAKRHELKPTEHSFLFNKANEGLEFIEVASPSEMA